MKKSEIYHEKGANLASKINLEVAKNFRLQAKERRQPIKYSLEAAVKLWTELPPEIQSRLLNQSLSPDSFIELIQQIVDERIETGRKVAKKTFSPQRKKRGQKG